MKFSSANFHMWSQIKHVEIFAKRCYCAMIIDENFLIDKRHFWFFSFFFQEGDVEGLDKTILFCTFNLFNMQTYFSFLCKNTIEFSGKEFYSFASNSGNSAVKFVEPFTHVIVKAYPSCSCKCFSLSHPLRIFHKIIPAWECEIQTRATKK